MSLSHLPHGPSHGNPHPHDIWSHVVMYASALGVLVAGVSTAFLIVERAATSLTAATAILTALIAMYWAMSVWWVKLATRDMEEIKSRGGRVVDVLADADQAAQSMSTAGALVVTVQGVVLGLVFAFSNGRPILVTAKVGIGSLAVGVCTGLLLVSLCAFSLPGRRTRAVSFLLFNLAIWSLSYGLVCIAAAAIAS
ncbi:hypothetical protein [Streptomyces sp. NBC_01443]|uniref:hypothetical protein n=1 Tax=Streptomyces sp. NBC_01443 TaxID=2903868 RepID=UPI0022512576|nr:hypothetical protein [Streptomyces sp. NBC_01443]MCX4626044.1 hypothetical protein [Streptomyces sp. NBC_01443]